MNDDRSMERLRVHYEVERELAERIRNSTRRERKALYPDLYDKLFELVPDHPRLTIQLTKDDVRLAVQARLRLLKNSLSRDTRFLEIAPGDCTLAHAVCDLVKSVVAADISPQAIDTSSTPDNFEFVQYDGYTLPISDATIDVAFSYQFLEHLHPDDVDLHMKEVYRVLKPNGIYVFDTPHRFSGPHDVSRHFSKVAQCFHLKEWTFCELIELTEKHGFSESIVFRLGKPRPNAFTKTMTTMGERFLKPLPIWLRRLIANRFYQSVTMIAKK